ncbi:MAG: hypothetical protein ACTHKE_09195 [Sphingomicrobium sp.]
MKKVVLLAGMILIGFTAVASADEYYVVRDAKTKHCTVVTKRPETKEVVTQIGPIAFKSREEADSRIKQTKVCTED